MRGSMGLADTGTSFTDADLTKSTAKLENPFSSILSKDQYEAIVWVHDEGPEPEGG